MVYTTPEIKVEPLPTAASNKAHRVDMVFCKRDKIIRIEVLNKKQHGRRKTF